MKAGHHDDKEYGTFATGSTPGINLNLLVLPPEALHQPLLAHPGLAVHSQGLQTLDLHLHCPSNIVALSLAETPVEPETLQGLPIHPSQLFSFLNLVATFIENLLLREMVWRLGQFTFLNDLKLTRKFGLS